jgi:type IV fimbrial biogenesis protein FimT
MVGIVASLAVPSFRTFLINQQLASVGSNFLGAMVQARSEAIKQGKIVAVLPSNGTDWTSGWYLSVVNNSCAPTGSAFAKSDVAGEFVTVKSSGTTNSFAATNPSFAYNPVGFPYISCASPYYSGAMNGTLIFETLETAREKRIIVSNSGRARLCDPKTDTASPPCSGS